MVPRLTTALSGPLQDLERRILDRMPDIERWLRTKWLEHTVPFYASVDLRNAGFKLAPVDTNLFPGGFNNLNPAFMPLCVQAVQTAVERVCPDARGVLLVPENHTRNTFYLRNVATLAGILRQAGMRVRIGTLLPEIAQATRIDLPDGEAIVLEPIVRRARRVGLADFDPCMVLLNNDLSAGRPAVLEDIDQPVAPPLSAGWYNRRKSHHFDLYRGVAREFGELLGIDPWLVDPYFGVCGEIDFQERTGEECLRSNVDFLLARIRAKYAEYGIDEQPFVIVKADAGTYGMGIMTVRDASEVVGLNRKQRNKMAVVKEGLEVTSVIIQEGVHTFESIDDAIAEPVVYMIDRFVVGGFYRVHTARGKDENLNAPGAQFVPLAFEAPCIPDPQGPAGCAPNRFYAYGVVARLAQLAAALEIEALENAVPAAALA
ncbi:MAG: glutamate--cysteine ligase [Burkholderiales bacterium]|nr:glutamate--cysteine ligase [Burkholderiales bacterium]GIK87930.1 MAG: glutamate--cysteine ligase [Betaproteobacteria bacterium]